MDENFYVYVYLDPRKPGNYTFDEFRFDYEPFYVGKGKGNRSKSHITKFILENDRNKLKVNKIKKIIKEDLKVVIEKVVENLEEKEAFYLETRLIKLIGRKDKKLGTLTNLTDGGEGMSGYIMPEKTKNKLRKRIVSLETRKKISEANKGNKSWCQGLTKENNEILLKVSEKMKESFASGRLKKKFGEDNPNYGNEWTQEQKDKLSNYQKEHSIFVLNNPQKINPNRGMKNGISTYKYLIYDKEILIMETYSLTEASEKLQLNYNMLKKISVNGHKYLKRFEVQRIKYREEDI